MSKNYTFIFPGTREEFDDILNKYRESYEFREDGFLIETNGDKLSFGIERSGYTRGFQYIPTITETEGKTVFSGKITCSEKKTVGDFLFTPIALIIKLYFHILLLTEKRLGHPPQKEEKTEDRLFTLMEDRLGCISKGRNSMQIPSFVLFSYTGQNAS